MPIVNDATEAITSASYRSPKTVLAFFAVIVGVLVSGAVITVAAVARFVELHYLIVPILSFTACVVLLVLVCVFVTAWKDPTILMLGQVTGDIYIQNRKLTLGDSTVGDIQGVSLMKSLPELTGASSTSDEAGRE